MAKKNTPVKRIRPELYNEIMNFEGDDWMTKQILFYNDYKKLKVRRKIDEITF